MSISGKETLSASDKFLSDFTMKEGDTFLMPGFAYTVFVVVPMKPLLASQSDEKR